jgi:hypothetical protein
MLNDDAKTILLAYRMFESIAKSRSSLAIAAASERNREGSSSPTESWRAGDFIHRTWNVRNLRLILSNGLICGEATGSGSKKDKFPFNVDFFQIQPGDEFGSSGDWSYGDIALVARRDKDSTDFQRDTRGGLKNHRLVFGALPSTELSALILKKGTDAHLEGEVIESVVEHGMYMPVYRQDGSLILAPEDFAARRQDGNYESVKPRVVDQSFERKGTQAGSNEGAWFIMPGEHGIENWYVKFGDQSTERAAHVWSEVLADKLYREVTPQLVPDTEAIVVEGRLARASKAVNLAGDQSPVTNEARNAGFIMDCFLGNWDAVYNVQNLEMTTDGRAMRIDTGGSLLYRARGGRKEGSSFDGIVREVEFGGDTEHLGLGMRQMYPDLTDEEIKQQVHALRDRLPDGRIDQLVDSVRMSLSDRLKLKEVLKARRDYLEERFLGETQTA